MAIENLAGNFQPSSTTSGNKLPPAASRAPSTSKSLDTSVAKVATELKAVSETSSTKIEKVEDIQARKVEAKQPKVESQIEQLQQFNQSIDRSIQFQIDDELGVTVVRVVDVETDELIRQFPPEELLNLSRRLKELNEQHTGNSGVLLQEKV